MRTTSIHTYAKTLKMLVIVKTPRSSMHFISSIETIDTAVMMNKLKAADPTIVLGPNSSGSSSMSITVSTTASMISGAEEPRAIKVRLATVGFQTVFSTTSSFPKLSLSTVSEVYEVISSIDSMKMSETIAIPRNM